MSLQGRARLGAAAVVGVLLGIVDIVTHTWRHGMGRDAFLAYQARMFDWLYAKEYPAIKSLLFGGLFAVVILGVYELVARGFLKAARSTEGRNADLPGPGGGA